MSDGLLSPYQSDSRQLSQLEPRRDYRTITSARRNDQGQSCTISPLMGSGIDRYQTEELDSQKREAKVKGPVVWIADIVPIFSSSIL